MFSFDWTKYDFLLVEKNLSELRAPRTRLCQFKAPLLSVSEKFVELQQQKTAKTLSSKRHGNRIQEHVLFRCAVLLSFVRSLSLICVAQHLCHHKWSIRMTLKFRFCRMLPKRREWTKTFTNRTYVFMCWHKGVRTPTEMKSRHEIRHFTILCTLLSRSAWISRNKNLISGTTWRNSIRWSQNQKVNDVNFILCLCAKRWQSVRLIRFDFESNGKFTWRQSKHFNWRLVDHSFSFFCAHCCRSMHNTGMQF